MEENKVLTEQNIDQLAEFFDENTQFTFIEFAGFCIGVASAPRNISVEQWQNVFLGDAQFKDEAEEQEIRTYMHTLYTMLDYELTQNPYSHTFFGQLIDPEITEEDTKAIMYEWMSGYWLGLQIAGQEWTNSGLHQEALEYIFAIDAVCEQLQDEKRFVTPQDINVIQAQVKLFFDYWNQNRISGDDVTDAELLECQSCDCDSEDCAPTDSVVFEDTDSNNDICC